MEKLNKRDFIELFARDLFSLGIRPGGILMVHPALRPFGHVPGGADTIIKGLLTALGEEGTLLMPALSWENVTRQNPLFDLNHTPSCVGTIAETFRLTPGVKRSLHPTHSVCGFGHLAEELTYPHFQDHTPCGPNSPFHRLPDYKCQILMLACGLNYNTSLHAIEELIEPPYLYGPPIAYSLTDNNNKTYQKEYIPHNFVGWRQRYDRVENLLSYPDLISGKVVGVKSSLIEASELWESALSTMSKVNLYFIDRNI